MATKKENITLEQDANAKLALRERSRKELIKKLQREPKVRVSVSPMYKPYYGSSVMVSIQGIAVYVPANGKTYSIPKSFAGALYESIAAIDAQIQKTTRMSQVQENFETSVGELRF